MQTTQVSQLQERSKPLLQSSPLGQRIFEQVLQKIAQNHVSAGEGGETPLTQEKLLDSLSNKELLLLQIQMSGTHLRVEMTAKVADSVQSIFKRLQQG